MASSDFHLTKTKTAEKFLDALQIRRPTWLEQGRIASDWVFRGHANAKWMLLPRSMRPDSDEIIARYRREARPLAEQVVNADKRVPRSEASIPPLERCYQVLAQMGAEERAVEEFIRLADHVGHQIPVEGVMRFSGPSYGPELLKEWWDSYVLNEEPSLGFLPSPIDYSLAQHHGIPTRLVDWTHSSFVAAYFAAEEAFLWELGSCPRKEPKPKYIAVWALDQTVIPHSDDHLTKFRLRRLTLQKGKISYLGAQSGLFIYDRKAYIDYLNFGRWIPHEEVVASSHLVNEHILRKVTVPVSEAANVLRMLAAEGYTKAQLMPSFDTVAQTQKLHVLLEEYFEGAST